MKNKKLVIGIVALVILLSVSMILYKQLSKDHMPSSQSNQQEEVKEDEKVYAPDFTVYNREGEKVSLYSLKGKPVILNFWASWCGNCELEMPHFQAMYEKYGDDIHFVMVDMVDQQRETQEIGTEYIDQAGYTFPIYFDNDMDVAYKYGVYALPTTYFLDADLSLVQGFTGALNEEMLKENVDRLLK